MTDAELKDTIMKRFFRGASQQSVAQALGLNYRGFRALLLRLELADPPPEWITRLEASQALGLQQQGTLDLCKKLGVRVGNWSKGIAIIRAKDLGKLLDYQESQRVPLVDQAPAGYWTAQQMADRHKISGDSLRTRLARDKVKPDFRVRVPHTAATPALYTLHQLAPYLPSPSKPAAVPAGWLTAKQMGGAVGVGVTVVREWVKAGAPCLRVSHSRQVGAIIFQPAQLAKWLTTSTVPNGAYRAYLLNRWLGQQQRAA